MTWIPQPARRSRAFATHEVSREASARPVHDRCMGPGQRSVLAWRDGRPRVTVARIATDLGVAPSAVYRHKSLDGWTRNGAHIASLEKELDTAVGRVQEIQTELAIARTLLAVTPVNGSDKT